MNGYKAFYRGRLPIEVYALTSYEAQTEAARRFKAKRQGDITVVLCEKDGKQVTHNPAILPGA